MSVKGRGWDCVCVKGRGGIVCLSRAGVGLCDYVCQGQGVGLCLSRAGGGIV